MSFEWDEEKRRINLRNHRVDFADAVTALEDEDAVTLQDEGEEEDRFLTLGSESLRTGLGGCLHLAWRQDTRDICPKGNSPRAKAVRRSVMKREYDFSKGKRGPVVAADRGKTRITIRLDTDILDWFREQVVKAGGGNYQTMMNNALREYVRDRKEPLEKTIRRVIREELKKRGAA